MQIIILSVIVFLSHAVEGITGFGCMILALPFVASLIGVKEAVPILVILSTVFDILLVIRDRKHINWRIMLIITIGCGIFMPVGFYFFKNLPEAVLMPALGVMLCLIAVLGFFKTISKSKENVLQNKNGLSKLNKYAALILPFAGLVQGAFGGCGPFLVIYTSKKLPDKTEFRGTMAAVWIVLNFINLIQYVFTGMLTQNVMLTSVYLIPSILLGFVLGVAVHNKISKKKFSLLIYTIIFCSGITMLF